MRSVYRLTPLARQDIATIWERIAFDNPAAADRTIESFHRRFALLGTQPLIGEQCDDLETGLRRFVLGSYVAYYRVGVDRVEVARVVHGAQDVTRIEWA